MLRFFRINDPYRLVGLLVVFLLLASPFFLYSSGLTWPELSSLVIGQKIRDGFTPYSELLDSTAPLTQWMYGALDSILGSNLSLRHAFSFIVLFLQACYLGVMLVSKKAFTENSYVPSLMFCVLCVVSFDMLSATGILLASGFLLLAIHSLFKEIEFREPNDETLIRVGVYLSLASLSVFSYAIFFFGAQLILILFTRYSVRRQLLFTMGFVTPHFLLIAWYVFVNRETELLDYFYLANLWTDATHWVSFKSLLILLSVPLFYLFVSIVFLSRSVRLSNYQSQLLQAMFIWLITGVVHLFFTSSLSPQNLLPLFPPLSFLFTHLLLSIRRKRIAEFNVWVLILGVIVVSNLTRSGAFTESTYKAMLVPTVQQRYSTASILLLSPNQQRLASTPLATGFCEWKLTKEVFTKPHLYESVLRVEQQFLLDPPALIFDPEGLMTPFFRALPSISKIYYKKGDLFYLKNEKHGGKKKA